MKKPVKRSAGARRRQGHVLREARRPKQTVGDIYLQGADDLLSGPQLRRMLGGASRMALHRWQLTAGLPRPVKLGHGVQARNFWRRGDVIAWIARRAGEQGGPG
jgi:predicted DNA-binding transcriptional regulator AlpA